MASDTGAMSYQSRMHAFEEILDPSSALRVVNIPQLRSLSLQGIPEHPAWMRSRIWRLLLGALPPEKDKWEDTARKSRTRYYDVAAQLLDPIQSAPPPEYPLNARDKLLDTIAKDVDRTQPRIPFFRRPIHARQAWPTPADPGNAESKPEVADAIFDRLLLVQRVVRFGTSAPPPTLPHTPEIRVLDVPSAEDGDETAKEGGDDKKDGKRASGEVKPESKPQNESDSDSDDQPLAFKAGGRSSLGVSPKTLSPSLSPFPSQVALPRLQLNGRSNSMDEPLETKTHAHILLRILFVYSLLHPHHPYTQGLNELIAPLYYTVFEGRTTGLRSYTLGVHREEQVGEAALRSSNNTQQTEEDDPTQHIEADTFWLFVELMGELGSVVGDPGDWSLPPVATASGEGVRGVMVRLSERLRWADARLWEDMAKKSLDPRLPYFSYRWIACLLAQDLPLTALLPVWDTLLAQAPSTPETNAKIEWLLDVCVTLLLGVRDRLIRAGNKRGGVGLWGEEDEEEDVPLSMIQSRPSSPIGMNGSGVAGMNEGFVQGMLLLQRYPLESIGLEWVLNKAFELGAKRAAGFGIQDERSGGAGWGDGAWGVAAAMRERVAGWRSVQPASAPAEGAASTTPVPEVLVSPPAPAIAAVGDRLRQYTETFKQSDTAASLSKASTNWSLAVMSAWNRSGGGGAQNPRGEQAGSPAAPSPPPKDGRTHGHGHGRSDSWAGWGATAVAAAKLRAAALAKAHTPEPVPEETQDEPQTARQEVEWEPRRSPGDRSQSLSPTALAKVMATTQPIVPPQQRSATTIAHPSTPRSAKEPSSDYEPPPRPAFFKAPRDSWMPPPKTTEPQPQEDDTLSPGAIPPPIPSPNSQRYTMTLPGWSAVPPPSSPASSGAKKTGPKPLLLGKNRSPATNAPAAARFRGMSRQSSVSSSTGSHREWEFMNAASPRSESGRPDSGSFARSRRSVGTASVPTSAPGSVVPSEDEAVVVGLGLIPGGTPSDNGSPPHGALGLNPSMFSSPVMVTPAEMKRTSSPLSVSAGPGSLSTGTGSTDSSRGWQLADGPVTAEPAPVRKWELTDDGPAPSSVEVVEPKSKAETLPTDLKHTNSTATVRKYELTDGPAPTRATTEPVKAAAEGSLPASPVVVPPAPRKWELSDNPVPRIDSNVSQMTADSDAADSPVNPHASTKLWPKRISSNRPTNLRVKTRPASTVTINEAKTPAADALRTPMIDKDTSVTPTSATNLAYMRTPSPTNMEVPLPQVEQPTPRRKKAGQQPPTQNRRSRVARGAARAPEVMSEEDGVKADAEDGEYEDLLSAYETETDDNSQGVGNAR